MTESNLKPIEPRLLNIDDAARYLGMGQWKLRRLVWAGAIPFIQLKRGAALQFDVQDLDRWIAEHKQKH